MEFQYKTGRLIWTSQIMRVWDTWYYVNTDKNNKQNNTWNTWETFFLSSLYVNIKTYMLHCILVHFNIRYKFKIIESSNIWHSKQSWPSLSHKCLLRRFYMLWYKLTVNGDCIPFVHFWWYQFCTAVVRDEPQTCCGIPMTLRQHRDQMRAEVAENDSPLRADSAAGILCRGLNPIKQSMGRSSGWHLLSNFKFHWYLTSSVTWTTA